MRLTLLFSLVAISLFATTYAVKLDLDGEAKLPMKTALGILKKNTRVSVISYLKRHGLSHYLRLVVRIKTLARLIKKATRRHRKGESEEGGRAEEDAVVEDEIGVPEEEIAEDDQALGLSVEDDFVQDEVVEDEVVEDDGIGEDVAEEEIFEEDEDAPPGEDEVVEDDAALIAEWNVAQAAQNGTIAELDVAQETQNRTIITKSRLLLERRKVLALHNKYRARHDAKNLKLNNALNTIALMRAKEIAKAGKVPSWNAKYRGQAIGENVQIGTGLTGEKCTQLWYNQRKKHNFKSNVVIPLTRKFTQLVWKDTQEIGFGLALHRNARKVRVVCVAVYFKAGNINGQFLKNVKQASC